MGYAHEYADAIMHRGRVPMEPADFVPDWADRPRKSKFYPGAETFPLPDDGYPADATVDRGVFRHPGPLSVSRPQPADVPGAFTLPLLGGMLLDSYGLVGRRLGVQANTDLAALPFYPQANWSRGTASGGGLYPVSVYWVSGPSSPLTPGIYHYATRHHGMQRLLAGDVSGEVRAALGEEAAGGAYTDQYLVLGIKFWQNSFKYNNFSFHAVSMDIGTILQTWRMWAGARGLRIAPNLWFDEPRLTKLLGIRGAEEGIFAVVPLHWAGAAPPATTAPPATGVPSPDLVGVRHQDSESSRRVLTFDALRRMHTATTEHAAERPAPGALAPAAAPPPRAGVAPHPLPAPTPLDMSVRTALRERRSSFGRFDASRPISREQLAATLAASYAGTHLDTDVTRAGTELATLYVFVNHVAGLAPGGYAYDPAAHALHPITAGPPGPFLQRNYFLANYNLEQAAAVMVPTVRTTAILDAIGDRGYRLVGATIGALSQTFYTSAAALGLGAGVALGFDNISFIEELGLEATGEAPLLIMLVGNERPRPADFRHEIA
ncbi:SagB/ThcOx family dehydrogenase [Streptomyces zagrosensis]|uniref:SagB-type dehydrogenase family enzyme n=1 Tax=Streptomyces zagrosensis TaxID=1042984 RepID=A0A7W9QDW3_9ACTN|nr:nitroreductase family protein [Streptomyces zagrosensis]MBB5937933.1 SagB-type dehydrogenase family enzyme [Streptomyces zagrosensis]